MPPFPHQDAYSLYAVQQLKTDERSRFLEWLEKDCCHGMHEAYLDAEKRVTEFQSAVSRASVAASQDEALHYIAEIQRLAPVLAEWAEWKRMRIRFASQLSVEPFHIVLSPSGPYR